MTVYVFIAEVNSRCEAASRRQLLGPFSDWQPRQLTLAHTSPDQHLSRALRPLGLLLYSNTILKQVCQRQWPRWVSGCRRSVWRCSASLESVSSTTCMQGSSPAAWLLSGDDDIYIHIRSHYLTVLTVIVCAGAALEVILSVDEAGWRVKMTMMMLMAREKARWFLLSVRKCPVSGRVMWTHCMLLL